MPVTVVYANNKQAVHLSLTLLLNPPTLSWYRAVCAQFLALLEVAVRMR